MLTRAELTEQYRYEPQSGLFYRRKKMGKYPAGSQSGSISSDGYCIIKMGRQRYKAHRLAWLYVHGEDPANHIDHINRDKSDNRIVNLRLATTAQNKANSSANRNSLSGLKGVGWHKKAGRWQASIKIAGKNVYLGLFVSKEEAHAAYLRAAKVVFGEFAREA